MTPMRSADAPTPHALTPTCGATTRAGTPCAHAAGERTDHPGQGRCWLHGGATPIRHGRYSKIRRTRLGELIAHHEDDPNPLDMLPELAAARALFQDFVERYEENRAALIAWHESYRASAVPLAAEKVLALRAVLAEYEELGQGGDGLTETQLADLALARSCVDRLAAGAEVAGKPTRVLDLSDAYRIVSEITKIVERLEQKRAGGEGVSVDQLGRLFVAMAAVVMRHVADPAVRDQIQEEWRALHL